MSTVLVSSVSEVRFLRVEAVVIGERNGNSFDSRLTDQLQLFLWKTSEALSKTRAFTTGKYIVDRFPITKLNIILLM